jgi:hypothetical protein
MARDKKVFDMVQNVRGRNEIPRKPQSIVKNGNRDDHWFNDPLGWVPPGLASYNEPVPYQDPGTSGMGDTQIGLMYGNNPEWFGQGGMFSSFQNPWSDMYDMYESVGIWEDFLASGEDPEYWSTLGMGYDPAQQEAGYNFWYGPYGPGQSEWTNWEATSFFQPTWDSIYDWMPQSGGYGPGNIGFQQVQGGGSIGGSGDIGTGSAFAGGSMFSTLVGEGLWDYDCATQGPSYNTQGECIACCG